MLKRSKYSSDDKLDGLILNRDTTALSLIHYEEEYKLIVLRNKLKVLFFGFFLLLLGIFFGLIYYSWIYYSHWNVECNIGLIYMYLFDKQSQEGYLYFSFQEKKIGNKIISSELSTYDNYRIGGLTCFTMLISGAGLHIFSMYQIAVIFKNKDPAIDPKICCKNLTLHILIFLLYFFGVISWISSSKFSIEQLGNAGLGFLVTWISIFGFFLLTIVCFHLEREIKRQELVFRLLHPDI